MMCCISLARMARGVVARLLATGQITCERESCAPALQLAGCPGLLVHAKQAQQPPRSQPAWTPQPTPDHASKRTHVEDMRLVTAVASSLGVPCMR